MVRRHLVRPLLLALAVAAAAPLGACYVQTRGAVVVDAPPPRARRVRVEPRPGYIWVDGFWVSQGGRWAWRDGYWVRSRPNQIYVEGRIQTREWTDKEGKQARTTEIRADRIVLLGGGGGGGPRPARDRQVDTGESGGGDYGGPVDAPNDDDIPF